jgi:DNA-binding response OmpR family regulator
MELIAVLAIEDRRKIMSEVGVQEAAQPIIVFVVEDQELLQELLIHPLEEAGYAVLLASSGTEAIDLLESEKGETIRALVTDINLGRSPPSGWDVARRARELHPELPVVYVTGDGAEQWPSLGVPKSVLISKPFAPAQVVTAVSQLLNTASAPPAA